MCEACGQEGAHHPAANGPAANDAMDVDANADAAMAAALQEQEYHMGGGGSTDAAAAAVFVPELPLAMAAAGGAAAGPTPAYAGTPAFDGGGGAAAAPAAPAAAFGVASSGPSSAPAFAAPALGDLTGAGGGMNPSAAAEFTAEPRHHKEFRAELGTVAHLCLLLYSQESFGRTFDGSGQASPSFVSSVCATQCQELLFWLLYGSVQSMLLSHGHPDGGAATFNMLPPDW